MSSQETSQSTILVVDDTLENLDVLIDSMEEFGFNFSVARNGEEMFRRLEQMIPDMILLDVRMPGMDGFEACRRLKEHEEFKNIPVIFMTALVDTFDKVKGFELGAVDYITKPFQQEEVLARVRAHLTIQHLQQDLRAKNQELQSALDRERKMLDDLRVNISYSLPHELRTPLHVILGFTGTILDSKTLPEPKKLFKYIHSIHQNSRRLQRLIENALLYADLKLLRYASHKREAQQNTHPYDVTEIIEPIVRQRVEEMHRQNDVVLKLSKSKIRVSPRNIAKILTELIDNAFKFSSPGTPVSIISELEGNQYTLCISDQGRGMSQRQVAEMNAYMQFERQRYEQQGIGLGLVIARLLTILEGGEFHIESEVEKGTSVQLVFQVDPADEYSLNAQIYDPAFEETPESFESRKSPSLIDLPAQAELEKLHNLIYMGDVIEFGKYLEKLVLSDSRYTPFVEKLRPLAEAIQVEQIQEFLEKYLHEKD